MRYYNSCMLNIFLSMVLKRKTLSSIRNKNKTFFQAKIQSTYFLALINRFLYKNNETLFSGACCFNTGTVILWVSHVNPPIYINFCSFEIFLCNLPGEFCPFIKVSLAVCCFSRFKVRLPADRSTAYTHWCDPQYVWCPHTFTDLKTHTHTRTAGANESGITTGMFLASQKRLFWKSQLMFILINNAWKHVLLHSDRVSEQCVSCSGISQLTVDREVR